MEPAVILVWKLWTVYARMFGVTAFLSSVIEIRRLFKSTKWRHFENVKVEALSAQRVRINSQSLSQSKSNNFSQCVIRG